MARTALIVNLLTEDNLPSYHHEIATLFGRDGAWGTWVHRWTAEEGRHGIAIRDYLTVSRAVDPVALERARMEHMQAGYAQRATTTRCCTRSRTWRSRSWPPGSRTATPARPPATRSPSSCWPGSPPTRTCTWCSTATCSAAAFELAPSQAMRAVADVVADFQMPGANIEGFGRKALSIALAGIYDLRQHRDEVLQPVLRQWNVCDRTDLDAEGEQAREQLAAHMDELDTQASRFEEKREARRQRQIQKL